MKTSDRLFNRKQHQLYNTQQDQSSGNYSFVDVVFLVVMLCLISMTKLVALDLVKVPNPITSIVHQIDLNSKDFAVITVTDNKKYFFNKRPVSDLAKLASLLKNAKATSNKKLTVVVNCERGLLLDDAVLLMQIIVNDAGIPTSQIYLKVEKEKH